MALSSSSLKPYPYPYGSPRFSDKTLPTVILEPEAPFFDPGDWQFAGPCKGCNCTVTLTADEIDASSLLDQHKTSCCGTAVRLKIVG